jgi:hypothetical protein
MFLSLMIGNFLLDEIFPYTAPLPKEEYKKLVTAFYAGDEEEVERLIKRTTESWET